MRAPTSLSRRFIKYVFGFGVVVAVGLSPFLGKAAVPGFDALLSLYPPDLRSVLIPLASFLMGLIALAVQFYSAEAVSRRGIRRLFRIGLITLVTGVLLLICLYNFLVVRVPFEGGRRVVAVVIAPSRLAKPRCECDDTIDDTECIQQISLGHIESCWGSRPLRLSRLSLGLSYLIVTSGFGVLVGLLLLQEGTRPSTSA